MTARNKLSDMQCQKAKPRPKQYKLTDGQRLYLLVKPNGTKTFQMGYTRPSGKAGTLTFGVYPVPCSLATARDKRDEALELLDQGLDPADEKKRAKVRRRVEAEADHTLDYWVSHWCERQTWADKTRRVNESQLKRFAVDKLGDMDVREIDYRHVLGVLEEMQDTGKLDTMHKVRGMLVSVFDQIQVRDIRDDARNPAEGLVKALKKRKPTRDGFKMLDPDLLGKFMRKLDCESHAVSEQFRAATELYILTVPRPDNVRKARWEQIDLRRRLWTIPGEMMKGSRRDDHLVPLSDQAVELLKWIRKQDWTDKEWLFPNHGWQNTRHPYISENAIANVCDAMGFEAHIMRPHGLRKSFSTVMNMLGFHRDAIERALDHVPGKNDVRAIYNKAEYMPERKEIMAFWGFYLQTQKDGDCDPEAVLDLWQADSNVVPLKRASG